MDSKNVKVIDEHGIDRNANVICAFNVDNMDYVLYWIERDEDNDNLFVSKIVNNLDGTSNMVNIEDSMEKTKVTDLVKDLVTYAVNNEADVSSGKVTLSNGKDVNISNAIFNKEQNINVSKTYITTVKKNVTKVSEDFYKSNKSNGSIFTDNSNNVIQNADLPLPSGDAVAENKLDESNSVKPVLSEETSVPVLSTPEVSSEVTPEPILPTEKTEVSPVIPQPVTEVQPVLPTSEVSPVVAPEPVLPTEKVEVSPVIPQPVVTEVKPVLPTPEVSPVVASEPVLPTEKVEASPVIPQPVVTEVKPVLPTPEVSPVVASEPVLPTEKVEASPVIPQPVTEVQPVISTPEVNPIITVNSANPQPLIFDGSKETNLNTALSESPSSNQVKVDDVSPFREFGQNETNSVSVEPSVAMTPTQTNSNAKVLKKSRGFANNKFVMVAAILLFIAACVFLGYEAFKYFQLTAK